MLICGLWLCSSSPAFAQSQSDCTLTWPAATDTVDDGTPGLVAGYLVFAGNLPRIWLVVLDVGLALTAACSQFPTVPDHDFMYFTVAAYDHAGNLAHIGSSNIVQTPLQIIRD